MQLHHNMTEQDKCKLIGLLQENLTEENTPYKCFNHLVYWKRELYQ